MECHLSVGTPITPCGCGVSCLVRLACPKLRPPCRPSVASQHRCLPGSIPAHTHTHTPLVPALQVLAESGFLYDSTILETPDGGSVSQGMAARLWPYTLQDGVAQDCKRFA